MNLTLTARLHHNTSNSADDSVILRINTKQLRCDMKMSRREFASFYKLKSRYNNILKILKSVAILHKPPIHTLESSKHPLNLVRLSL
jgi:hypothetical protein